MLVSFDKLTRMLIQERRLGYKNKAVMGGLEKLVPNWSDEARQEVTRESEHQVIDEVSEALSHYPEISDEKRPNYIHRLLVKLHKANEAAKAAAKKKKQEEKENRKADVTSSPQEKQKSPPPKSSPKPAVSSKKPKSKPKPSPPKVVARKKKVEEVHSDFADVGLNASVTKLPGIKVGMARKLDRLGVQTVGDFLSLYPRRYDDYRRLKPINRLQYGEEVTIIAQIWDTRKRETRNRRSIVTTTLSDGTGTIEVTWFNQPWLVNRLKPGKQVVVSGKVGSYLGRLNFQSPDWEELDNDLLHTGRIVPVYPLTQGITAKWLRTRIKTAVDYWASRLTDHLSAEARQRLRFLTLNEAVEQIHFPDNWDKLDAARRRLAFDELLLIQLGVLRQRRAWNKQEGFPVNISSESVVHLLEALPFQLTEAQRRSLDEIVADLKKDVPMSRLLQGDVGSGKTVVALAAMVLTALDGGQAAMLAPTEILSEQHFKGMSELLQPISQALNRKFEVALLTGSTSAAERRRVLLALENGEIDILVGTHAIIQSKVQLNKLRLAVIDEQHRFGVDQRAALREKGYNPHMLVMTATPIPRSLALTLYGDLDLSIIDELPPGRQEVQTRWLAPRERERAYSYLKSQVEEGRQAFIICPLVEESDNTEAKSAIEEHKRLQTRIFPRLKLGLLHGRMKADEKEKVMTAFRDGKTHILVSTSVVEVGIDIPNASVILIEGANRFGLAQLHQFRGRVGRGEHRSACLLLADKNTPEVEQRLQAIESTSNGFDLAEKDLAMRGPGEFFGTRQSGLPDLKLVKLSDTKLLEMAREEAALIFEQDPELEQSKHRQLMRRLEEFWNRTGGDLS